MTEPEARYFVRQVVLACQYLHGHNIIHRDLKLGNLFINDDMDIKVGDFGLATRVDYDGERKRYGDCKLLLFFFFMGRKGCIILPVNER